LDITDYQCNLNLSNINLTRSSYGSISIYSDSLGTIGSLFVDYNSQITIHLTNNSTSINNVRVLSLSNILLQNYILDLSLILSDLSNKIYTNLI